MRKAYADSIDIQIHYRYVGQGAPVVLCCHPALRSSKALGSLRNTLAYDFQVFIPDLPDYDKSDSLILQVQAIDDYVKYKNHSLYFLTL
jgi:pimeloyl-ACP methyl ester carboxylesterase